MAYHLYHTEGIVLGSKDTGESNRFYFILTRDLGLVGAVAQSARASKSKLRGHLSVGTRGAMTFVRGRDVWRITAADEIAVFSLEDVSRQRMVARMAQLLRRLVHGEECDQDLYEEVSGALTFLKEHDEAVKNRELFEMAFAARMLAHLGYGVFDESHNEVLAAEWGSEMLARAGAHQRTLVRAVNDALRASQL